MCCTGRPTKPAVRRLSRRLVPATLAELAIVCGADRAGRGDPDAPNPAAAWLEMGRDLTVSERPAKGLLTGDHLIAAGMVRGMNVGELIYYLTTQPRDRQVILEKDAEGNGYSPLADATEGLYEADSTWSGEMYPIPEDIAADLASGARKPEDEADRYDPSGWAERVVVLGR